METTLNPDDITCGICFEVYDNPKILPCVHTFCEHCISDYIQHNRSSSMAQKGIFCPTCREFVPIPNPARNVDEWASQLKSNFFIKNLIQSVGPNPKKAVAEANQIMCAKHLKELDLVCVDCDTVVCVTCVAVAHRMCRQVYTIKEAAEEKRETITALLQNVDARLRRNSTIDRDLKEEEKILQHERGKALMSIQNTFDALVKVLTAEMHKAAQQVNEKFEEAQGVLNVEKKCITESSAPLQKIAKEAEKVLKDQDLGVVNHSSVLQGRLENFITHEMLKDTVQGKVPCYQIEFLPENQSNWLNLRLGEVKMTQTHKVVKMPQISLQASQKQKPPVTPSAPMENRPGSIQLQHSPRQIPFQGAGSASSPTSPTFGSLLMNPAALLTCNNTVAVKVKGDKAKPQVRDIAVITGNVIVLTDGGNNAVKSFYTQGRDLQHSRYVASGQPHGVSVLAGSTVVVTVPRQKEILMLSVTPNIFLQKTITTSKRYWGITAVTADALAVTVCPGSGSALVELVNLQGDVLVVVRDRLMSNPLYMACTLSGELLISDPTLPSGLVCVRQNGYMVFKYSPKSTAEEIKRPMGVAVDKGGSVVVVDQACNSTVLLTPDGSFVKKLTTVSSGSKKVVSVALGERGFLVIAQENQLMVYTVSVKQ